MPDAMRINIRRFLLGASPYLFILPFVIFCLVLLFYPVIYSLALSFREATVETFVSGEMPFNGLTQYQAALADPVFWRAFVITLIFGSSAFFPVHHWAFLALLFHADFPQNFAWPHCLFRGFAGLDRCQYLQRALNSWS
jgi:multiple sugar transport system permease protein